jgi:hypothetical protein
MTQRVVAIKCTHVVAHVSLGFYDAEGNLVGEELFPQNQGNVIRAQLFHPHQDQLVRLIETCVEQAWAKIQRNAPEERSPDERLFSLENEFDPSLCELALGPGDQDRCIPSG